jgi:hypothetical protein
VTQRQLESQSHIIIAAHSPHTATQSYTTETGHEDICTHSPYTSTHTHYRERTRGHRRSPCIRTHYTTAEDRAQSHHCATHFHTPLPPLLHCPTLLSPLVRLQHTTHTTSSLFYHLTPSPLTPGTSSHHTYSLSLPLPSSPSTPLPF